MNNTKYQMNNALAFASRRIPYIPELLPICNGSPSSTILMMQLEHWFSYSYGNNRKQFYKFLKPCSHSAYKPGDSWTEEIGFSEKVFRSSFDNIGVRYKSLSALKRAQLEDKDPFQGKMYLSYIDARERVTYYIRNDLLVDETISRALNAFGSSDDSCEEVDAIEDITANAHRASTQTPKQDLRNGATVTCVTNHGAVSYKETKMTTEKTTKKTAARSTDAGCQNEDDYSSPVAAAFSQGEKRKKWEQPALVDVEPELADMLTSKQAAVVDLFAQDFCDQCDTSRDQLSKEIQYTLLSPSSFSNAGKDFHKKINTIRKIIEQGRWTSPAGLKEEQKKAELDVLQPLKKAYSDACDEVGHWNQMITLAKERGDTDQECEFSKLLSVAVEKQRQCLQVMESYQSNVSASEG